MQTTAIREVKMGERIHIEFSHGLSISVMVFPDNEVAVFLVLNGVYVGEIRGGNA